MKEDDHTEFFSMTNRLATGHSAVLEVMRARLDPHAESEAAATREAKRLAGRWVARQLVIHSINADTLYVASDLDEHVLTFLIIGLAEERQLPASTQVALAAILADQQHPLSEVHVILDIAIGRTGDAHTTKIQALAAELNWEMQAPHTRHLNRLPARKRVI